MVVDKEDNNLKIPTNNQEDKIITTTKTTTKTTKTKTIIPDKGHNPIVIVTDKVCQE